jgi:chemotaxis protein MotC
LAEFASVGAEAVSAGVDKTPDPRAQLYNALATVTSDSIEAVSQKLAGIDPNDLSKRDVRLLKAAKEVVRKVLAKPITPDNSANDEQEDENVARAEPQPGPDKAASAPAGEVLAEAQPSVRVVHTERIPVQLDDGPLPLQTAPAGQADMKQPSMERLTGEAAAPRAEPQMELVVETRKKLDEIDRLLGETQ